MKDGPFLPVTNNDKTPERTFFIKESEKLNPTIIRRFYTKPGSVEKENQCHVVVRPDVDFLTTKIR